MANGFNNNLTRNKMILKLKVWLLKKLLNDVSKHGHDGDVYLAHINKFEHKLLKAVGGEASINPDTGLVQYKGGGGGGGTTTNEIDPKMWPYVENVVQEAQGLYEKGAPEYYKGQTYLDPNKATSDSMSMGMKLARGGNNYLSGAQETVGNHQTSVNPALAQYQAMGGQNYRTGNNDAIGGFKGLQGNKITTGNNDAIGGFKDLQGNTITSGTNEALAGMRGLQGGNTNMALAGTQATANGDYLQNNPNFNAVMDSAGKKASDIYNAATQNTASSASQAGRYGSNAHARLQAGNAGKLADSLANTAGQYAYQNYGAERANQENAIGRLGDISNNQFNQQMQATQGLGNLADNQLGRDMNAQQNTFGNQLSATQGLSSANEAQFGREMNAQQNNFSNSLSATQGLSSANESQFGRQDNANQNNFNNNLAATQGLGNLSESQANRQLNAAGMAPSMANAQYQDIDRLSQYGQQQEGYDQTALNADIARHDYGQNANMQHLQNFANIVNGVPMGSKSTTSNSGGGK